jgi:hypothetical protein
MPPRDPRAVVLALLTSLAACTFGSAGNSGSGNSLGEDGMANDGTTAGGDADSNGDQAGTIAGGSGDGASSPSEDTATGDTTGAPGDSGSSVQTEHLQHAPFADCSRPLWCYTGGVIFNGNGAPVRATECFMSTLTPPIELHAVQYVVAVDNSDFGDFQLQVRGFNGGPPGSVLESVAIASNSIAEGLNEIVLAEPIILETAGFCVGFATRQGMQVGFAVDEGAACVPGGSQIAIEGFGVCDLPEFMEVCGSGANPEGNWCFSADVARLGPE